MGLSQRWRLVSDFLLHKSVHFTFSPSPKTPVASPECQWSDRQADIQTDRQLDRQLDRQADMQTDRQLDRQTDRQLGRQVDRQADVGTDRQADMQPAAEQVGKLKKNI
jgi:hypothetical protein